MVTISHSEVESMMLCERKWFYGYALSIQSTKVSDALNRGNLGHSAFEILYKAIHAGKGLEAALAEAREFLYHSIDGTNGKIVDEVTKLMTGHIKANPFGGYEILAVEKEFVLEVSPGVTYPFVVDLIVRDSRGRLAVVDHKFQYDFLTSNEISVMPQIPKYIGALRALGHDISYGIYNQARYRSMKEPMDSPERQQTVPFTPTDHRIARTFEEQLYGTEKVIERKSWTPEEQSQKSLRVANKMVCKTCSFLTICAAELEGSDSTSLIMRSQYKSRERRVFVEEE